MAALPLYYLSGFSTVGSALAMTGVVGGVPGTVAAATYAHSTFEVVTGAGKYSAFGVAVKAMMDAAGGGPYTVTFAVDTGVPGITYTVSRAVGNFTFAFSGAAGTRLRRALGFGADLSGATSYTSTIRPYYCNVPEIGARSDFSDVYEPNDIVEEAVSDGGTAYAVARNTSELWSDWTQQMETKEETLTRSAAALVPWTWQDFVRHVRGQHPFAVYSSSDGSHTVHKLRADGAYSHPERVSPDYDGLWNIPFRTRDLGSLA